jgi:hypothetical protein
MPTHAERSRPRVRLIVAKVTRTGDSAPVLEFPLAVTSVAAGAAAAGVGWLLVTGLAMAAWFSVMAMPLTGVISVASQFWLAGHGAGATINGVPVTLIPLGLTALCVLLARSVVSLAVRAIPAEELDGLGAAKVMGLASVGYAVVVGIVALTVGASPRIGWALLGGLIVGVLGAAWALAARVRALLPLPTWLTGLPRAVGAGLAAMTAVAATVLLVALIVGSERIGMIEGSLGPDAVGTWLLVIVQLLFLPNLLAWTASWVLGAGFSMGVGSFVSPMLTTVGLLPAVPAFGAVPESGGGSVWSYAWLASGVLVGAVAGTAAAMRPAVGGSLARALARGAGSGLGTALAVVLIGALSRGDLGSGRLVGLGPVVFTLLWLAPLPMIVGGALAAAVHWFVKGRHLPPGPKPVTADDTTQLLSGVTERLEQETLVLGRRDG